MSCSGTFWLWFTRPFAEALGALAMVGSVVLGLAIVFGLYLLYAAGAESVKAWRKRRGH